MAALAVPEGRATCTGVWELLAMRVASADFKEDIIAGKGRGGQGILTKPTC